MSSFVDKVIWKDECYWNNLVVFVVYYVLWTGRWCWSTFGITMSSISCEVWLIAWYETVGWLSCNLCKESKHMISASSAIVCNCFLIWQMINKSPWLSVQMIQWNMYYMTPVYINKDYMDPKPSTSSNILVVVCSRSGGTKQTEFLKSRCFLF